MAREVSTSSEFGGFDFDVVLRGYDRDQVDRYLEALSQADSQAPPPPFRIVRRGYDRGQVDARIAGLLQDKDVST